MEGIARKFAIILSDGAPTVTVNADTDTVGTIKSSFWGTQKNAAGVKYQNARCGGGWTHPAEVAQTLQYLKTGSTGLDEKQLVDCIAITKDNVDKLKTFVYKE